MLYNKGTIKNIHYLCRNNPIKLNTYPEYCSLTS